MTSDLHSKLLHHDINFRLLEFSLDVASRTGSGPPIYSVEQCSCPEGYFGTSCEVSSNPLYKHSNTACMCVCSPYIHHSVYCHCLCQCDINSTNMISSIVSIVFFNFLQLRAVHQVIIESVIC